MAKTKLFVVATTNNCLIVNKTCLSIRNLDFALVCNFHLYQSQTIMDEFEKVYHIFHRPLMKGKIEKLTVRCSQDIESVARSHTDKSRRPFWKPEVNLYISLISKPNGSILM